MTGIHPTLSIFHRLAFRTILVAVAAAAAPVFGDGERRILFFGDSLTAGYGIDPNQAYPALIQEKLQANGRTDRVVNAGVSGETTSGGLRRIDWVLRQPVDVVVLALGGNDALRGIPPEVTQSNIRGMIETVNERRPDALIVLAGMQAPPNMGRDYVEAFAAVYTELANAHDVEFIPFLLEGVGGDPSLNLPDGMHPTPEGHRIIAEHLWTTLKPFLLD